MDLNTTIDEIGILETNSLIEKYLSNDKMIKNLSVHIPISNSIVSEKIVDKVVSILLNSGKRKLLLLSNEVALFEKLRLYSEYFDDIYVILSRNLVSEQINNIKRNVPNGIEIKYINELDFPKNFRPRDSIVIAFGYKSNDKCLIPKNTYRILEIYNDFLGEKLFVSCSLNDINYRLKNWISVNSKKYFTSILIESNKYEKIK